MNRRAERLVGRVSEGGSEPNRVSGGWGVVSVANGPQALPTRAYRAHH